MRCARAGDDNYAQLVTGRIATIEYEKNAQMALSLVEETASTSFWRMGALGGPVDSTKLTMRVLYGCETFVPWKESNAGQIDAGINSEIRQWLRADPNNESSMLSMLRSENPTARWIACEKLKAVGNTTVAVVNELRRLTADDPYFAITRQSIHGNLHDEEAIFDAPIRRMADDILRVSGNESLLVSKGDLSRQGLVWLGQLYLDHKEDKDARIGIAGALIMLSPTIPEIAEIQTEIKGDFTSLIEALYMRSPEYFF